MKATGIVRRIDDLGRVVIPKEIRRTLRIRVGDPLEIYTDREGEVILKKYSLMGDMGIFAQQYADSLAQTTGYQVVVTDREQVIAASAAARKEMMDKAVSKDMEQMIDRREITVASGESREYRKICDEEEPFAWEVICPIISEGNARRGGEKAGACGSRISGKTAGAVEISSLPEGDGLVFRYTVKRYLKAKMYKRNF